MYWQRLGPDKNKAGARYFWSRKKVRGLADKKWGSNSYRARIDKVFLAWPFSDKDVRSPLKMALGTRFFYLNKRTAVNTYPSSVNLTKSIPQPTVGRRHLRGCLLNRALINQRMSTSQIRLRSMMFDRKPRFVEEEPKQCRLRVSKKQGKSKILFLGDF